MIDLATIRELVGHDLLTTDEVIEDCLKSEIPLIKQVGQHLIHSGGKRLRPLMVLLGARAFGYQGQDHIKLAAVIELIHTATLIHDDVVDTSELRRSQKTANAIWGNAVSVLVGDFLYSRAFQVMVSINNIRVMEVLANATNKIAAGEVLQLLNCKDPDTDEARYMEVIKAKTGTLFATAAQLGAIITNQSEQIIQTMMDFGMKLGIAFQLIDDALDYSTDSKILGKNQGDDLAEGKPTLPLIYALQHGNEDEIRCIRNAIEQASCAELDTILTTIQSTGAITYTHQLAADFAKQAAILLNEIPSSPYKQAMITLTEFTVARTY